MRSYTSGLGGDDLERHYECGTQPQFSRNTNISDYLFHSIYSHRSWRVRPRRLRILTKVDVYVLADWEFWPKLACTSSPIEHFDLSDASRFLRPWELFSPSLSKITHPWAMFRDSLEHPPRYCVRRRLGPKTNCRWLSLTLQVSNAYYCNRKFLGDYENEVNIIFLVPFPLSSSRSWRLTVAYWNISFNCLLDSTHG
jgi:hypothetical protein